MSDLFRRLLHPTLLVLIVWSVWSLAQAQIPVESDPVYQKKGTIRFVACDPVEEVATAAAVDAEGD